jgi:hypothetical protein
VNTVHSGMAPLTVIALGTMGIRLAKEEVVGRSEYVCYAGLAVSIVGLWPVRAYAIVAVAARQKRVSSDREETP